MAVRPHEIRCVVMGKGEEEKPTTPHQAARQLSWHRQPCFLHPKSSCLIPSNPHNGVEINTPVWLLRLIRPIYTFLDPPAHPFASKCVLFKPWTVMRSVPQSCEALTGLPQFIRLGIPRGLFQGRGGRLGHLLHQGFKSPPWTKKRLQ